MDRICRIRILLHHEAHEGNEVKPGSAGRLTGFMHFAFGDQRLAVGARPARRRWRVMETVYYDFLIDNFIDSIEV